MSKSNTPIRVEPGDKTKLLCPMCGYERIHITYTHSTNQLGTPASVRMHGECEDDCQFTIRIVLKPGDVHVELENGTTWNQRHTHGEAS